MSDEKNRLSQRFKLFLTFHFSLGFSIEYSKKRIDQLSKLNVIAEKLNNSEKFTGYRWSVEEFGRQFPLSLRAKHGYLLGTCKEATKALTKIKKRFSECSRVELGTESIKEDIVYFDHGVGSVNLLIEGELKSVEAIEHFRALALSIQQDIQGPKDKSLHVFDKWPEFKESMSEAFEKYKDKRWDITFLRKEGKKRGLTRFVGTGALFYIDETANLEGFKIEFEVLKKCCLVSRACTQ